MTFGKRKGDRETRLWNDEVQGSIKEKKEAKKTWDKIRDKKKKDVQHVRVMKDENGNVMVSLEAVLKT